MCEEMYNCDETRSNNFKMLASKSLAFREEKSTHDYERNKEQVIILTCFKEYELKCALCSI